MWLERLNQRSAFLRVLNMTIMHHATCMDQPRRDGQPLFLIAESFILYHATSLRLRATPLTSKMIVMTFVSIFSTSLALDLPITLG